jgi:hypothetical protein
MLGEFIATQHSAMIMIPGRIDFLFIGWLPDVGSRAAIVTCWHFIAQPAAHAMSTIDLYMDNLDLRESHIIHKRE